MSTQPAPDGDTPKSFAALRHPGSRIYLIGAALAMMADSIEHVISYWMIFQQFESRALGGFAVIAHWAPFLFFSFFAGALADRYDPRRLIQIGMVMFMGVSIAWGVLFHTDSLEMWHAVVLLVIHGFAGVIWSPAAQLLVHDIVGPVHLPSAIRLIATSRTLGFLLGPAIGGVMMLAFGPATGILLNAAFYVPLALWLAWAPYGPKFRAAGAVARGRAIKGFSDVAATLKDIAGHPVIIPMLLVAGGTSLFVGNAHQAQMPEFARDFGYGDGGIHYSMLLAANAAGAVIAGLILETRGKRLAGPGAVYTMVMIWCAAMAGFALTDAYYVALALLFIGGFLDLSYNSTAQALVQTHAPAAIRGRVIGLYHMGHSGLRTVSGFTIGVGGEFVGIHWSVAMSAGLLAMVTLGLVGATTRRPAPAGE